MEKQITDTEQERPREPTSNQVNDYIRVAIVGNVDSGKSTLVGVLTKSFLDDGRGSARLRVFNYPHEAVRGQTSSIAQEIMGFNDQGIQVFPDRFVANKNKYWSEVVSQATKVVSLIDLCGHEKYLKTTMLGMVGMVPDYVMIVVGANLGLSKMTKEHLGIALALNIPFFIVVTKVDMVSDEITKQTLSDISKLLKTSVVNKRTLVIDFDAPPSSARENHPNKAEADLKSENTEDRFNPGSVSQREFEILEKAVNLIKSDRVCPIFMISSTVGYGVPQLSRFFSILSSRVRDTKIFSDPDAPVQFDIHERFLVNGVGLVVSGLLRSGTIKIGQSLILGPDKNNSYRQVTVKSIHFNRQPVEIAKSGQFCCFALKSAKKKEELDKKDFRKGIVLLDSSLLPTYAVGFEADIAVLHHATTIKPGYECVMHCGVIRQSVRIVSMDRDILRTGDNGKLVFRFMFNSEYVKPDLPFLLREGRTKILGVITKVFGDLPSLEAYNPGLPKEESHA